MTNLKTLYLHYQSAYRRIWENGDLPWGECVPLTISYHLYFLHISKVSSMLLHGSAEQVQSEKCYFIFTCTFLACFLLFFIKKFVFNISISFLMKYRISTKECWPIRSRNKWQETVKGTAWGLQPIKSHDTLIMWSSRIMWQTKTIIAPTPQHLQPQNLGKMVTYLERLPPTNLLDSLVTWSCKITWQTIISSLPQRL